MLPSTGGRLVDSFTSAMADLDRCLVADERRRVLIDHRKGPPLMSMTDQQLSCECPLHEQFGWGPIGLTRRAPGSITLPPDV